jgi:L-glyceraldehyde 3-phosphate reductase
MTDRYSAMPFRRCGTAGLKLPVISLGLWHNFGGVGTDAGRHADEAAFHANAQQIVHTAFDCGITCFDLANNYGPPPGAAEERFGRILKELPRDELVITSKAGYRMWPGPYGDGGSRKYLIASCDASLRRLGLDYVDIFYYHRPDGETPIEESLGALEQIVRSGKALYAGISNMDGGRTAECVRLAAGRFPLIINQVKYSALHRGPEYDMFPVARRLGLGVTAFSPLAQGLLAGKYGQGIPADSRAAVGGHLKPQHVTDAALARVRALEPIARARSQSLSQFALAWALRDPVMASVIIGASRPEQVRENCAAAANLTFTNDEIAAIDRVLG